MKKILTLLFLITLSKLSFGQNNEFPGVYLQSPNAASLGVYGKVDVSPFTGIPSISIPVFSVNQGDINVSANLRYMAGGVKPEDHSGWVGQNWSLNVGGVVTRKKNGEIDEIYFDKESDTESNKNKFSYYLNFGALNTPLWDSESFMTNYLSNDVVLKHYTLLSPDEFMFTLPNGKSGSFMKNALGEWQVKSDQEGRFFIKVDLSPTTEPYLQLVNGNNRQSVRRFIYQIIISDDEGFEYTFGGTMNAVEFIRSSFSGSSTYAKDNIFSNAWHLVKIVSPKGNVVNFTYERGTHQFIQGISYGHTISMNMKNNNCSGFVINPVNYSGYIITPSYLKGISSATFSIDFQKTISYELKYNYGAPRLLPGAPHAFNNFNYADFITTHYPDIKTNGEHLVDANPHVDYKLSGILIKNSVGKVKENYFFNYNNDSQGPPGGPVISFAPSSANITSKSLLEQRLFLEGFSKYPASKEYSQTIDYKFKYYTPDLLPPYNSLMVDQWGYYNGKEYPMNQKLNIDVNALKAKYTPDLNYAKMGSLSQIIYPTGGISEFEYEMNDYGGQLEKIPGQIIYNVASGSGGGLRIKKVKNYSSANEFTSKSYFYTDSTGTRSSGIIAGLKKIYYNVQLGIAPNGGSAEYVTNNSLSDLNYTNGRDVVYSRVKEVLEDGSSYIYKYSNSDDLKYRDENPNYVFTSGGGYSTIPGTGTFGFPVSSSRTFPLMSHTSREMERGKLLSKETYSAAGKLVSKQVNEYRNDPERYNEFVKSFAYGGHQLSCDGVMIAERYIEPSKYYTYFSYLKKQTDYNYDVNGGLTTSIAKQYVYNDLYRVIKEDSYVNSESKNVKNTYKYAFDFPGNTEPYQGMIAKNLTSRVIEKINRLDTTQIHLERTNYSLQNTSMYLPTSSEVRVGHNEPSKRFYEYDAFGNLTSSLPDKGIRTSFKWGYQNQYPTAKTQNASKEEFYTEDFENSTITGVVSGYAHTGNKFLIAPSYQLNWTKPNSKSYNYSYWYRLNNKWKLEGPLPYTGSALLNKGDAYDDIRIFPADALMETYTYEPIVGMTSHTDAKGQTLYYNYDNLQRLSVVMDQDSSIVKNYEYNMYRTASYNVEYSGEFTKNNCAGGAQGSKVRYVVPAGTYVSYIGIEYANGLAQWDVIDNGQAYANANGTCGPLPTLFSSYSIKNSTKTDSNGEFSAYISNVRIKNAAGVDVTPPFNSIPYGTYTYEIEVVGPPTDQTTFLGWGSIYMIVGPLQTGDHYWVNNDPSKSVFVIPNVVIDKPYYTFDLLYYYTF